MTVGQSGTEIGKVRFWLSGVEAVATESVFHSCSGLVGRSQQFLVDSEVGTDFFWDQDIIALMVGREIVAVDHGYQLRQAGQTVLRVE